jgi:hypothetical protein
MKNTDYFPTIIIKTFKIKIFSSFCLILFPFISTFAQHPPDVGPITGELFHCSGDADTYTVPATLPPQYEYLWLVENSTAPIILGQLTNTVLIVFPPTSKSTFQVHCQARLIGTNTLGTAAHIVVRRVLSSPVFITPLTTVLGSDTAPVGSPVYDYSNVTVYGALYYHIEGNANTFIRKDSLDTNWVQVLNTTTPTFQATFLCHPTTSFGVLNVTAVHGTACLTSATRVLHIGITKCNGNRIAGDVSSSEIPPNGNKIEGEVSSFHISPLSVYPNPATDKITISFFSYQKEKITLSLTDMMGRNFILNSYSSVEGNNSIELNLNKIPKGIYVMTKESIDGKDQKKVIIN